MTKVAKNKSIKKLFSSKPDEWRIEAVIHDGNWYDIKKWAKVAKVSCEDIENWINAHEDIIIKSDQDSYRVGYEEIVNWYTKEKIDIDENIIPNNFPPKLWAKKTETDVFLAAPRRRVGTVSFEAGSTDLLNKCIEILKGTAKVMPDKDGRYKAHGLSAVHMKNLLSRGLTAREFNSLDLKTRAVLMQRELLDFPKEWLEPALDFYVNTFAPTALKSSMPTISIYLPDKEDINSQTVIWVIQAMKKFNEEASVPFPGYLSTVLRHWPYNLPDEQLGKELSKFQRDRKKAIDMAVEEGYTYDNVPLEIVAEFMDMSLEDYISMTGEHEAWLAEKNATTLTWEDSSNEKMGKHIGEKEVVRGDRSKMSQISLATIKAAVDTESWDCAYEIISQMDQNDIDESLREKLKPVFLESFYSHLIEVMRR